MDTESLRSQWNSDQFQSVIQISRLLVQILGSKSEIDARLLALHVERDSSGETSGQRLRAAHSAQSGGQNPSASQIPAVVLPSGLGEVS